MNSLAVSVIIPTHNRAQLIGRAVENALWVMQPNDEVIVVDDGSTDDTAEALRPYLGRILYFRAPHGGAGAARNHGVRLATRPLLAFLDSDDQWMPDKLLLQRTLLEVRPDVLYTFSDFTGSETEDGPVIPRYLRFWHRDERPWDEILAPGVPYSTLASLPVGRDDFCVHIGSMYFNEMESDYLATTTVVVRRLEVGPTFRFAEDLTISEDKEAFAHMAKVGQGAYLDCDTSYQWAHRGPRLTTETNTYRLARARLKIMERVWGQDPEFLAVHEKAYLCKQREQHLLLARWCLVRGQMTEARQEIEAAGAPTPWQYRLLAPLPAVVVKALLAVRRLVRS